MSVLCFSGWGQKYDSLEFIFSDPFFIGQQISSADYLSYQSFEEFAANFGDRFSRVVIGWSLGAFVSSRLISQGKLSCDLLVLIAPPFQFIANQKCHEAMILDDFNNFVSKFSRSKQAAFAKFAKMIAYGDSKDRFILSDLAFSDSPYLKYWLEYLGNASCFELEFNNFPKTLIIAGKSDILVNYSQSAYFKQRIEKCQVKIVNQASHGLHLSNPDLVRHSIIKAL